MLHTFAEHAEAKLDGVVVEAVEKSFSVAIHDPETGEVLEEQLVGTMDLVALDDGRRVVVEHKTSAKKYAADQLRFDIQPTAYKLAAQAGGHGRGRVEVPDRHEDQGAGRSRSPTSRATPKTRTTSSAPPGRPQGHRRGGQLPDSRLGVSGLPVRPCLQGRWVVKKLVSVGAELAAIRRVPGGGGGLSQHGDIRPDPVERDRRLVAVLNLTAERIRLLRRSVVGAVDARELLAPHNESDAPTPGDDPDILLVPGSPSPLVPKPIRASPCPHVPHPPRSSKGTKGRRGRG